MSPPQVGVQISVLGNGKGMAETILASRLRLAELPGAFGPVCPAVHAFSRSVERVLCFGRATTRRTGWAPRGRKARPRATLARIHWRILSGASSVREYHKPSNSNIFSDRPITSSGVRPRLVMLRQQPPRVSTDSRRICDVWDLCLSGRPAETYWPLRDCRTGCPRIPVPCPQLIPTGARQIPCY